jgi:ribosomal protein S18 acetylase RimI-like enzyme/predicted RNase H-like HicB family nuclease
VDTIRVWLEPGYDHGRTGAWMLDFPGAFAWGPTRDEAMARVASAVHRFVEWLEDHGEAPDHALPATTSIVEEVVAYRLPDGYEVNATFDGDRRTATRAELDETLRRLDYARADLLELCARIDAFEATGGSLASKARDADAISDGAAAGRTSDEVLAHIAGAETWFISRLDGSARYEGSRSGMEYLTSSHAFLRENLLRLFDEDPARSRVDGKGEEWTLAKVFRRAIYHSLDHLHELDRRLAIAEHLVDGVEVRKNAAIDYGQLKRLFGAGGLGRPASYSDELIARMLTGSTETASAWEGDRLIGFARLISDEAADGYISTVAIAPRWQDRGLGTKIMRALMEGRNGIKLIVDVRDGVGGFYERLGFERSTSLFVRRRR